MTPLSSPFSGGLGRSLAWLLGALWVLPLLLLGWAALRPGAGALQFDLAGPWGLDNFRAAWQVAPFGHYLLNTVAIVTLLLALQLTVCTLAAYALARLRFAGRGLVFALVLLQLMVMPEVLIAENYAAIARLGLVDRWPGVALPYVASAFGIFLLRQTFKTVPRELDEAARVEGCSFLAMLWKVYVPLARPVYIAFGLTSVSYHWNNFLWPLIVTNSVETRPLTVGLQIFSHADQGIDWALICAATLLKIGRAHV